MAVFGGLVVGGRAGVGGCGGGDDVAVQVGQFELDATRVVGGGGQPAGGAVEVAGPAAGGGFGSRGCVGAVGVVVGEGGAGGVGDGQVPVGGA